MHDFATFGEMLLSGIAEANRRFEEMQSEMRFLSNIDGGEDVYDVYMAKKKSGKPKDGEPSKFFLLQSSVLLLLHQFVVCSASDREQTRNLLLEINA